MKNLRNITDVRRVSKKKDYLKCTSKPGYMSHKIFDNNLVAFRKSKVALKLNIPAYTGMRIFELSKLLMYEFHHDYVKNKYDNKPKILFMDTDSLMCEIKTEYVYEDFSSDKNILDFSNYATTIVKSKYYYNSNKLFIHKMKGETAGIAIKEFAGLKSKMYSFLVDENSVHKKAKGVNRNVVATISHNEYKNVLLNNKCLRHSINRIQVKTME